MLHILAKHSNMFKLELFVVTKHIKEIVVDILELIDIENLYVKNMMDVEAP